VFKDGTLLLHETRRLKPDRDAVILSGMLLQFRISSRTLSRTKQNGNFGQIEFGENRIFIERGDYAYIAVVYSGSEPTGIYNKVKDALKLIERRYWDILETWDGDTQKLGHTRPIKTGTSRFEEELLEKEAELIDWESRLREEQARWESQLKEHRVRSRTNTRRLPSLKEQPTAR